MTDDQARPLERGDLGLPVYQVNEDQVLESPTIDLVAALVAREGVQVLETDTAMIITVPRQYPAATARQDGLAPPVAEAEVSAPAFFLPRDLVAFLGIVPGVEIRKGRKIDRTGRAEEDCLLLYVPEALL